MQYRVGMPGWRLAEKLGLRLYFRAIVNRDEEAGVFWASSPDIPGLVVEAKSLDELVKEISGAADGLLYEDARHIVADPVVRFHHALCAA